VESGLDDSDAGIALAKPSADSVALMLDAGLAHASISSQLAFVFDILAET
jgi:hypothetical protein